MIRTHIRLTAKQAGKIKKIASSRGVSMAEVIRGAVEGVIQSDTVLEERRIYALEVVGKFSSGKRDVSTKHDAYLAETIK